MNMLVRGLLIVLVAALSSFAYAQLTADRLLPAKTPVQGGYPSCDDNWETPS